LYQLVQDFSHQEGQLGLGHVLLDAEKWQVDVTCPLKPNLHHNALPSVRPGDSVQQKTRSRKLTENRFAIEDKKSVAETHHSNSFKNAEYSWIFCYDIHQNSGEETFGFAKPPVFYSVLPAEVRI